MIHVLLAEDNPGDVLLVEQALDEHHLEYKLLVAKDGAEALGLVARMGAPGDVPCPDIILLDLNLPKASGTQVLVELRSHPSCAHTPVIVVSSSDAQKDRDQVEQLGIARYFRKPFEFDAYMELGAVVRQVLEKDLVDAASSS